MEALSERSMIGMHNLAEDCKSYRESLKIEAEAYENLSSTNEDYEIGQRVLETRLASLEEEMIQSQWVKYLDEALDKVVALKTEKAKLTSDLEELKTTT